MPRDEGWTARWDYGQWQRGWAGPLGHMGREREREDRGPRDQETWACGLGWDEPMSGRWGFQLRGRRGRLQVMTSVDSWWRAGYEQGVVIRMKFIRSLSWLKSRQSMMAQRSWIKELHPPAWFHDLQCAPRVLSHSKQGLWSKTSPTSVASWLRISCWSWPGCWSTY